MPRPVRFVHAADLHLGAPFARVDAADPVVRDALVSATFGALDRLVTLTLEREADFLVIAGDVYNAADKGVYEQRRFQAAMTRLAEAAVPVYVAHGNHDPLDGWSAGFALPGNVHVFSAEKVERFVVERHGETVASVYGRSFPHRRVDANYARTFARSPEDAGRLAVGVLHANVGAAAGHEDYAPCTAKDLARAGMDYWALGHIHLPGRVVETPRAVYAGCPQGLQPNEDGPRGCYVVEAEGGGVEETFVGLAPVVWARRTLDVAAIDDVEGLVQALSRSCDEVRASSGDRATILRLELVGRGPVHSDLSRAGVLGDLLHDVRDEQMTRSPWLWLDRLRDATLAGIDVEAVVARDGFDGELARLAASWTEDAETASRLVDALLDEAQARLIVRPGIDLDPGDVVRRAADLCLGMLTDGE